MKITDSNELNILIERGADFVMPVYFDDDQGEPMDLTGAAVEAQLRRFAEDTEGFDFSCINNGTGGWIMMTMPAETTAAVSWPDAVYDLFVTLADGTRIKLLYGSAEVHAHVTKPLNGTGLFMIGIDRYAELPVTGKISRLYFCYEDRKIYRWNGVNYVATSVGNGIQRIDFKEHSSPFTDTYTVVYDDGTTWDYQVTCKGIQNVELISSTGNYLTGTTDTYRMYFNSGDYYDYSVHGGRVVFPVFDINWETGMLFVTDEMANITFSIDETTGMLSYTY